MLLRYFARCMVHIVHRPKLYGPKPVVEGPAIFVCRHVGLIDPVILMVLYFKKMIRPLVAKDYYEKSGFTRWFYRTAQCIPIDRRNASKDWLEASMAALEKGESIIIFPEGKRNKSGEGLLPFHHGASLLAARSGARVVPVWNAVWNFPHRYNLAIGEPFDPEPLPDGVETPEYIRRLTRKMQESVSALSEGVGN
ncbi:MAG: 1-acyl-sn-glycerol-3-phosphate acyltransferase [Bacteroidales bacterium]|nr:1-acyl-sn-glycerol-3-phosphate acyltransferase [Bacteroidales bacterium]